LLLRNRPSQNGSPAALEKFHLAQSFLCFSERFVRTSKIFPFAGKYFVTAFHFFDHDGPRALFTAPSGLQEPLRHTTRNLVYASCRLL
jgi:hypothetical protein